MRRPLNIGITCYPTVGGSGILASALGDDLARRGHEVHFISYERPFRLSDNAPRIHFHPVNISDYGLFRYPDYTLPLSVRMAEVSRDCRLDILHVHYAVPHATAAILAKSMLPVHQQPRIVTTLHGTDTTLMASDPDYGPAIRHALTCSDAITTVSHFLKSETERLLQINCSIDVIHNFFDPRPPQRSRDEVRRELRVGKELLLFHASNLRRLKRIDLLLETVARIQSRDAFKLLILAGESFGPYEEEVRRLGLGERIIVREKVMDIENYLQAADVGLFTSDSESFCLSILEAMNFHCPSVATRVGGIPELIEDQQTGILATAGNAEALAGAVESLLLDPARRNKMAIAAKSAARRQFSAEAIVPQYESLYRRVLGG